jgi:hypothetical protein
LLSGVVLCRPIRITFDQNFPNAVYLALDEAHCCFPLALDFGLLAFL